MKVDLIPILTQIGGGAAQRIKNNLSATGTNASGKTSNSVKFTVSEDGTIAHLQITGRPYIMAVETGIKPFPQYEKPSKDFVTAIRNWLGFIGGNLGAAWIIAKTIHQKGTRLWQKGGRKDIISNVVNPDLILQIQKATLDEYVKAFLEALKK